MANIPTYDFPHLLELQGWAKALQRVLGTPGSGPLKAWLGSGDSPWTWPRGAHFLPGWPAAMCHCNVEGYTPAPATPLLGVALPQVPKVPSLGCITWLVSFVMFGMDLSPGSLHFWRSFPSTVLKDKGLCLPLTCVWKIWERLWNFCLSPSLLHQPRRWKADTWRLLSPHRQELCFLFRTEVLAVSPGFKYHLLFILPFSFTPRSIFLTRVVGEPPLRTGTEFSFLFSLLGLSDGLMCNKQSLNLCLIYES